MDFIKGREKKEKKNRADWSCCVQGENTSFVCFFFCFVPLLYSWPTSFFRSFILWIRKLKMSFGSLVTFVSIFHSETLAFHYKSFVNSFCEMPFRVHRLYASIWLLALMSMWFDQWEDITWVCNNTNYNEMVDRYFVILTPVLLFITFQLQTTAITCNCRKQWLTEIEIFIRNSYWSFKKNRNFLKIKNLYLKKSKKLPEIVGNPKDYRAVSPDYQTEIPSPTPHTPWFDSRGIERYIIVAGVIDGGKRVNATQQLPGETVPMPFPESLS